MHFFGEHTFSFYNAENERFWCKFHFVTQQGIKNFTNEEAAKINGMDREYHGKDFYEVIESGNFPKWTMYVQIMTEEEAKNHYENPLDLEGAIYRYDPKDDPSRRIRPRNGREDGLSY